jgi:2,3-bisphosphoglycerate-dependent phosphoglycerate mutase
MTVLLIRHCESVGQGADAPLSEAGERAAVALVARLSALKPDALYSSPYARALATIAPFARLCGLAVQEDSRIRERTLSPHSQPEWREHLRKSFADHDYALEGGESFRTVRERGLAALADIVAKGHRFPAVATHGQWMTTVLSAIDPAFGFEEWQALKNPDLIAIDFNGSRPVAFRRI